jgi:hypothetical protein
VIPWHPAAEVLHPGAVTASTADNGDAMALRCIAKRARGTWKRSLKRWR